MCEYCFPLQLSPSFTPTSVIRKMYESKEKSKEEPTSGKAALGDGKEDTQKPSEGTSEPLSVWWSTSNVCASVQSLGQGPCCSGPLSGSNRRSGPAHSHLAT